VVPASHTLALRFASQVLVPVPIVPAPHVFPLPLVVFVMHSFPVPPVHVFWAPLPAHVLWKPAAVAQELLPVPLHSFFPEQVFGLHVFGEAGVHVFVALVRGRRHVQAYPAQKPPKAWFN